MGIAMTKNENANIALFCLEYAQQHAAMPCTQADIARAIGWVNRMAEIEILFNLLNDKVKDHENLC